MSRDILIVAYHFPPILQSSGLHRTVAFAEQLAAAGSNVTVLTITQNALPAISDDGMDDVPSSVRVVRAWGLDTTRHLALAGKYPGWLAIPDRYQTWIRPAVFIGKRLLKRMHKPVIFSTFPVSSAHEIALRLSTKTRVPWVADFRDPMHVPGETSKTLEKLEAAAVSRADAVVVTTPATRDLFSGRYGPAVREKVSVIPNGYGRTVRQVAASEAKSPSCAPNPQPLLLLHSGSVYGEFRNPSALFVAIAELRDAGDLAEGDIEVVFRGATLAPAVAEKLEQLKLGSLVNVLPMAAHSEAIQEMARAHAYLLLQGSQFNAQVPAKVYEYIAMRRPILALTDAVGATGKLLADIPASQIADMQDAGAIKRGLMALIEQVKADPTSRGLTHDVTSFDRQAGARHLVDIVNKL
ncbi:MAG: glycosyltransferase [Pseudomonadota bacterium]